LQPDAFRDAAAGAAGQDSVMGPRASAGVVG
jgi:hypothetical protein